MSGKNINSSLSQQYPALGEFRVFEIYNAKFMKVIKHDLFGEKSYHINLTMLEPWPIHHRQIAWRWLLAFIYCSISTIVFFIYQYRHAESEIAALMSPFIIVFFLLALLSLGFLLYKSPNVTEFRSRYGGCPLLSLMQNRPDQKSFTEFIQEIKTRILAASQNVTFDKQQMLAIEIQELGRLQEEGVLTQSQYIQAKERVLKIQL